MNKRLVVGPLFSHWGFRSWLWACTPDQIVSVPAGIWTTIEIGLVNSGHGGALVTSMQGTARQARLVERLESESDRELVAERSCRIYCVAELDSLICKRPWFGSPDVILRFQDGRPSKYGVAHPFAFDAILLALTDLYGDLVNRTIAF